MIDLSIDKPELIKDLLQTVGNYVDPCYIIEKIPEGIEIPDLRDTLQIVLRDATDRQKLWKSAETISSQDGLGLIQKLYKKRSAGLYFDKVSSTFSRGRPRSGLLVGPLRGPTKNSEGRVATL